MVDNALFISQEDEKFVVQEENLDKRIENVVRIIQQKVLQFYTQYESLHRIIKNSLNIRLELNQLKSCRKNLNDIHDLCVQEFKKFEKMGNEFKGSNKELYNQVLKDLEDMMVELKEYLKNLDYALGLISASESTPDDMTIRHGFEVTFDKLHATYNAFIRSDENLISVLNNIHKLAQLN